MRTNVIFFSVTMMKVYLLQYERKLHWVELLCEILDNKRSFQENVAQLFRKVSIKLHFLTRIASYMSTAKLRNTKTNHHFPERVLEIVERDISDLRRAFEKNIIPLFPRKELTKASNRIVQNITNHWEKYFHNQTIHIITENLGTNTEWN